MSAVPAEMMYAPLFSLLPKLCAPTSTLLTSNVDDMDIVTDAQQQPDPPRPYVCPTGKKKKQKNSFLHPPFFSVGLHGVRFRRWTRTQQGQRAPWEEAKERSPSSS